MPGLRYKVLPDPCQKFPPKFAGKLALWHLTPVPSVPRCAMIRIQGEPPPPPDPKLKVAPIPERPATGGGGGAGLGALPGLLSGLTKRVEELEARVMGLNSRVWAIEARLVERPLPDVEAGSGDRKPPPLAAKGPENLSRDVVSERGSTPPPAATNLPWEALGLTRRTYYRRKKEGKL